MSKTFRFGAVALPLMLSLFSATMMAQGTVPQEPAQPPAQQPAQPPAQQPAQPPAQQPAQPESPLPASPNQAGGAGIPPTMTVAPSKPAPPKEPYVLEDGGLYIQPFYWLNKAQPTLRGGLTAIGPGSFKYNGDAKAGIGVEIGIPAGRSNTLRISAFRIQGNTGTTLGKDTQILSQPYLAGDFINATYKLQAVKVSWDYLSYTFHKYSSPIHVKTLYEVQYVTTRVDTAAPFLAVTTDASGNVNDNTAGSSKAVVLPTLGMAIGSQLGKYVRWDARASGFGIPKRSAIGDVQATIAFHLSHLELLVGERFFYFKTSPRTDLSVTDTLQGVFGGIRYSWKGNL